jgi:hypothetical protein
MKNHSIIFCPQVWPFLLGYYKFGSTTAERIDQDAAMRTQYEDSMSQWLAVEAIVKQRDKENLEANLVHKYSTQESTGKC